MWYSSLLRQCTSRSVILILKLSKMACESTEEIIENLGEILPDITNRVAI